MSMSDPKMLLAIAEHSMCQPGLPSLHGDGHVGSPSLAFFHKAKSALFLFYPFSSSPSVSADTILFSLP